MLPGLPSIQALSNATLLAASPAFAVRIASCTVAASEGCCRAASVKSATASANLPSRPSAAAVHCAGRAGLSPVEISVLPAVIAAALPPILYSVSTNPSL